MCDAMGRLSLILQFGGLSLLVFLVQLHSCRGQSVLIGPSQPIVATVGDDIILPCYLEPVMNAYGMTLEWTRPDLEPRFVFLWREGVELETKYPSYKGRTSLFTDELKHGNISLKLSKVKLSDEGTYRCFVPELAKESAVKLVVGAVSSPHVQMTKQSNRVILQCESKGWYPEPEVLWLDGEGNLVSAGPTETVRGPDDLYTVSSRVTVDKRHSNRFTCRVQQNNINQTRETHIEVTASGAAASPVISLSGIDRDSGRMVLQCESKGWYPEPEVLWLDGEGNLVSAGPTETVRGPDDLYTVSSRVTVDKRHGNRFTCRVQQNNINQTRETHIDVPGDFSPNLPSSVPPAPVIIGSIVCIMCILAGALVVWKWRKNKQKNKKPNKDEEAGEKSSSISIDPEQKCLLEAETDRERPAQRTRVETVDNSSREETELQTQTEEEINQRKTNVLMAESGFDKGQVLTETKPVNENTDAPSLNEDKHETKSVSDNTATDREQLMRSRLTGTNLQTHEEEEEVDSTADGTRDQALMEEEKQGNLREERQTLNNLNKEEEKLTQKLKTKEREQAKFEKTISRKEGQMKDKEQQIKELRVKLEEVERKLQSVNREDDKMEPETEKEKDQSVKSPLDTKKDLETEKAELQKNLKKRETDIERIKREITNTTKKKIRSSK